MLENLSPLESLVIAQELEKRGHEFYGKAVKSYKTPVIQNMFATLRDQEKRHLDVFTSLYDQMVEAGERPLTEEERRIALENLGLQEFFLSFKNISDIVLPEDVLKRGIEAERRSIEYYEVFKNYSNNDHTKDIFQQIIEEEKKHEYDLGEILKLVEERGLDY
ncbi:rubrerythrin [Anaerosolibacter carboniphilus]|uniref:Rubrerythrin n=1 Tax=Anaerosolibacter carboniphilus TaxID=1417629 RepID=A0A841L8Y8_9FIRM|nr:ferritin family protein [Anaerosolibacter carboniphilus]MBB6218849.1 rubrerythrin [Anaerosolibacter carboniphilus]